jgi:toxin ParE1/3/4
MAEYQLSEAADADLNDILYFGLERFGHAQTLRYRDGLKAAFSQVLANPFAFQAVDDIWPGYRRAVYQRHAIYFKIIEDGVLIVRILGQQDVASHLP